MGSDMVGRAQEEAYHESERKSVALRKLHTLIENMLYQLVELGNIKMAISVGKQAKKIVNEALSLKPE